MKKTIFSMLWMALAVIGIQAQNYVALKDTIWGCRQFATDTVTGQPANSSSNKTGKNAISWPSSGTVELNYYVRIPTGHVKADMYYTPRIARQLKLNITITNETNKQVVYNHTLVSEYALSSRETSIELIPDMVFQADTWYQIKLRPAEGQVTNAPSRLRYLIFSHDATERVVSNTVAMAPSAHNNTWGTTDPNAPSGNEYEWVYGEFLYPDEYAFPNRYLMCLGGSGYYSGIQVTGSSLSHNALFSIWDNGDTDSDPNLPAYLRSGAVDHSEGVKINHFGGEGTGTQSMISPAAWKRGHWIQWLMNARPETVEVSIPQSNGRDSITTYPYTMITAWYKTDTDSSWFYISTTRQSGTTHLFGSAGEYSFLENYTDFGGDHYVRCYMRNRFYRSAGSGKWYNRNHMTPGHYNYNDGTRECRYDYGHGATSLYPNCFYIEHGGFGQVNDSSMYVPLATNTECVDTINLDRLQARIDQAFRNNNYSRASRAVDSLAALGDAQLIAYAKDIVDNAGGIGSYGANDLSGVIAAYNNGAPGDIEALKNALKDLALNHNQIRYANVTSRNHIGVRRAYVLESVDGTGLLHGAIVDGRPVLRVGKTDRTDPLANWIIHRSDRYGTIYVYNMGLRLYINTDSANYLSSTPENVGYLARTGRGWALGSAVASCLAANSDGTVSLGSGRSSNAQFLLHDNLALTPSDSLSESIVTQSNAANLFNEYKQMVPSILSTPDSVVGAWTDADELQQLSALYDNGNITEDKGPELISLIDDAKTIALSQEHVGVYQITSAISDNASTPYLTVDNDNYVYHRAATSKPDQLWLTIPKDGGWELSAQGVSLNTLSTSGNATITTTPQGDAPAYYLMSQGGGLYSMSNVQNGPTAVGGASSPLKTVVSSSNEKNWYLRPAQSINISLNSGGVGSLYLDFDVVLPEGLTAYTVDGFDQDGATLSPVGDTLYARTPAILQGQSYGTYKLAVLQSRTIRQINTPLQGTLLKKTGLKARSVYTVSLKSGKPTISLAVAGNVNANQCYIPKQDMDSLGLTQTSYPIDFNNITGISSAASTPSAKAAGRAWDIHGRATEPDAKGIIIRKGQKLLNK